MPFLIENPTIHSKKLCEFLRRVFLICIRNCNSHSKYFLIHPCHSSRDFFLFSGISDRKNPTPVEARRKESATRVRGGRLPRMSRSHCRRYGGSCARRDRGRTPLPARRREVPSEQRNPPRSCRKRQGRKRIERRSKREEA